MARASWWLKVKNPLANEDTGLIPGLGKIPHAGSNCSMHTTLNSASTTQESQRQMQEQRVFITISSPHATTREVSVAT